MNSNQSIIQEKKNWLLPVFGFLALTGTMLFFHEPWRDEVRDFALAIQCNSLQELIDFSQYDGHPAFWYLILYGISKFTTSIFAVQVVNILISALGVYIFLQYAPIRWTWKLLIVFGYFFIYEYSILFRSYATGITLLFLICEMINREKILWASTLIMVVVNANIFSFFIGGALWLVCIAAFFKTHLKELAIGSVIVALGALRSVMDFIPPKDYGISIGYQISFDGLAGGLANVWRAFVPIPIPNLQYWNSNFVSAFLPTPFDNYLMAIGSIFLILACLVQLRKSSIAIAFFLLLVGIIVGFTGIVYPGNLRHHGHLYITFLLALWLLPKFLDKDSAFTIFQNVKVLDFLAQKKWLQAFFPFIFIVHIFSGGIAYFMDSQNIFSYGKTVANYIQENKLSNRYLIGHYDATVSTVAAYLNQEMYFPQSGRSGTFVIWDRERARNVSEEALVELLSEKRKGQNGALLISSIKIKDQALLTKHNIQLIKSFEPSVVENFYLYE